MGETRWTLEVWVMAAMTVVHATIATALGLIGRSGDGAYTASMVAFAAFVVMNHIDKRLARARGENTDTTGGRK